MPRLSALERWQDSVAQNISSSQTSGYRKRTVNFSTEAAGETQNGSHSNVGHGGGVPMLFPKVNTGVNFIGGESHATGGELDVALKGDGFFEVQRADGTHAFTRSGQFQMTSDRTLVTPSGAAVLSDGGGPITFLPGGGPVTINPDGSVFQGDASLGKISVQQFADNSQLTVGAGGYFVAPEGVKPEPVAQPQLLQGYVEGSNVAPLREMVDLVLISRAYEANQKIINTVDQQMQKTLDALG